MVKFFRWLDCAFDQPKVLIDVGVPLLRDELGMSNRIPTILVDPRTQRREIVVSQFFFVVYVGAILQFDSVRATTTESVSGVQRCHELERVDEGFYVLPLLFQLRPFTPISLKC